MKLDRGLGILAVVVAVGAMGCASRSAPQPVCAQKTPVSTARIMAAELHGTDDAPKVGKSQHGGTATTSEDEGKKDAPQRRGDRKPGGGFSGYK